MTARLQIGIGPDNYGFSPFLNWAKANKQGFRLKVSGTDLSFADLVSASRVDSNGELIDITDATQYSRYIYLDPVSLSLKPNLLGREMTVDWENGTAVTSVTGLSISNIVPDLANNKATFKLSSASANTAVYLNLGATGTAPTNIRVYETAKAADLDTYIMDGDWVDFYKQYSILRLMDCMSTNGSAAVDYADLPSTSFTIWGGNSTTGGLKVGWPVEALIEIANRTGCPIWINIPHQFTDAAITSLAEALRDGITFTASEVRVYVEYSNEMWNSGSAFTQTTYCNTQGSAAAWTTGDSNQKGRQWSGYRAAQAMELFRTAFGTDSGSKWSGVLATQLANTFVTDQMLTGVNYHLNNDTGAADVPAKLFSNLAVAPYFGPVPSSDSTGVGLTLNGWLDSGQSVFNQNLYDALKLGTGDTTNTGSYLCLDTNQAWWLAQKVKADANGLGMMMYEGGYGGVTATAIQNSSPLVQALVDFAADWRCAQLHYDMYDQFVADTDGVCSKFVPVGPHSKFGSWGARETYDDLSETGNAIDAWNLNRPWTKHCRTFRTQASA